MQVVEQEKLVHFLVRSFHSYVSFDLLLIVLFHIVERFFIAVKVFEHV